MTPMTTTPSPRRALWLALAAAALLGACAGGPTTVPAQDETPQASSAPAQWQAPLPHGGQPAELVAWWQRFDDPVLVQLQEAAQGVSPTLAAARSRIEQARATRVAATGALLPGLDASASASRGRQDPSLPLNNSHAGGLQATWELDLFGGRRAARDAAQARLEGARAGWHEARVAVAAEVAGSYLGLRACEARLAQAQLDADSRAETSRLTGLSARAGFQSPANAALARASAAQGNGQRALLQSQCDIGVKALVALTGVDEPGLRSRLAPGLARLPEPAVLAVGTVPAEVLNQRPDLFDSARALEAASAEVSQARAARLPRVSLNGSIGAMRVETAMGSSDGSTWSLGPVSLTLPLFDGGTRRANVDAARARYDEAAVAYRAQVRTAVREVEEALIRLHGTETRQQDARTAVEGFEAAYRATDARFKGGLASLFELEDARRSSVQAQTALIDLQRERVDAWISLYRALGGGWTPSDGGPAATQQASAPRP
jgi:multidrug efflux system outer membrane protein